MTGELVAALLHTEANSSTKREQPPLKYKLYIQGERLLSSERLKWSAQPVYFPATNSLHGRVS